MVFRQSKVYMRRHPQKVHNETSLKFTWFGSSNIFKDKMSYLQCDKGK